MSLFRTAILLCWAGLTTLPGATFSFDTLPAGSLSGEPGETIGYGYTLSNPDLTRYLMMTGFASGSFAYATVNALFDFPVLLPGQSITVPFNNALQMGLLSLLIEVTAPVGFVNSGAFVVSAEFWDGDPLAGGTFSEVADDQVVGYEVTVVSPATTVPEPATAGLVALAAVLLWRARRS